MKIKQWLVLVLALIAFTSCQYEEVEIEEVRNFRVEKMTGERVHFSFDVKLLNPNNYALKVSSTDLLCEINGRNLGKLYLDETVRVPAGNKNFIPVLSSVTTEGASENILPILLGSVFNRAVDIRLKGEIRGGAFFFPKTIAIDHSERVDFDGSLPGS